MLPKLLSRAADTNALQATQGLKAGEVREFVVIRDEYKGGELKLSLRKIQVNICPFCQLLLPGLKSARLSMIGHYHAPSGYSAGW